MSTASHPNNFPKLHNAAWPGVVGKGEGSEPAIDLDTMLDLTAAAEVDGDQVRRRRPLPLRPPRRHRRLDDDLKALADKATARGLTIGSVVAPIWPPTGGGPAMDEGEGRKKFLEQVRKGCRIARETPRAGRPALRRRPVRLGHRRRRLGRPEGNQAKIAETFKQAGKIARDHGEKLAAEGEICWGGMHSWRKMVDLLERVGEPETVGFQADMAHTLLYTLGENAPEDRILPDHFDWKDKADPRRGLKTLTDGLRPWTIDFHVAQNDATVFGSGSHDHTGRHCLATDPNGKLDIPHHAGFWLRDENGKPHQGVQAHLLGRLHVPQRGDDGAARPGTTSSRR